MKLSDSIYWIYVVLRLFLSPSLLLLPIHCRHDNTHTVNRVLNLLTYLPTYLLRALAAATITVLIIRLLLCRTLCQCFQILQHWVLGLFLSEGDYEVFNVRN